jgi:ectonucleoside triphosphate diphosphohydrolase 4
MMIFRFLLLATALAVCNLAAAGDLDYGIAIDAGSGGTRLYIYCWPHAQSGQRAFITPRPLANGSISIKPGLSWFAADPSRVDDYLQPLLDFAVRRLGNESVPPDRFGEFRVYVKATAGMRLVEPVARHTIMANVRSLISRSPFFYSPSNIRVISGEEEGIGSIA